MINAETLHALVLNNFAIPIRFCGARMIVDGRGVLYWPQHDLLIFSDLHFEKGSFLTQFAHPVPRFDTKETLSRMQTLLDDYKPSHVLCLGDSFHDVNADKRIQAEDVDKLNTMISQVAKWTWVLGNHDPAVPSMLLGKSMPYVNMDGILLTHEPEDLVNDPAMQALACKGQIIGHFHPKTAYKVNQRRITGKSFLLGESLLIMPAFGKYTGGLSSDDGVFKTLFANKAPEILLSYNKKLFML